MGTKCCLLLKVQSGVGVHVKQNMQGLNRDSCYIIWVQSVAYWWKYRVV